MCAADTGIQRVEIRRDDEVASNVQALRARIEQAAPEAIVKMVQNRSTNPNGAQLLFTTHDAALMDSTLFRRDQIWIVEKDAAQGSQLYSLVDFEDKPRKSQPLFKAFLSGRFGGVPQLDETTIMQWPRGEP
jgi:hypothetical protein